MWIKICANTNLDDARMAAELGADAVGFVFAPSTRRVTATQVAEITPHLADVERVGVFYTHSAEEVASVVDEAGLNAVQLQDGVDRDLVLRLKEMLADGVVITQTLHWNVEGGSEERVRAQLLQIEQDGVVDRVLIDSKVGQALGGTGVSFDWKAAKAVLAGEGRLKLIVAGGLRPENVGEAIEQLRPWGVDVASGVEVSAGQKSPEKLRAFIRAARGEK
jgi:phosphoribosylanthranilate isomerase